MEKNKSERLDYLDGLKGIFTILVVVGHFGMMFNDKGYVGWGASEAALANAKAYYFANLPMSLFINNSMPVYLFMALIAFFPAYRYFKNKDNKSLIKSSVLRYFRFMPFVLISFIIAYLFQELGLYCDKEFVALTGSSWVELAFAERYPFTQILRDGLIIGYLKGSEIINSMWCLDYLFLGSLLAYVFVWIVANVNNRIWIYLGVSIFLLIDPSYIAFIAGVGAADMLCNHTDMMQNKGKMILFLIVGIIIGYFPSVLLPNFIAVETLYSVSCFFVLTGIIGLFSKTKLLNNKFLGYLGKTSFSLILIHMLVLFSITGYTYVWLINAGLNATLAVSAAFVVFIIISLIASDLFQRLVGPIAAKLSSTVSKLFNL